MVDRGRVVFTVLAGVRQRVSSCRSIRAMKNFFVALAMIVVILMVIAILLFTFIPRDMM